MATSIPGFTRLTFVLVAITLLTVSAFADGARPVLSLDGEWRFCPALKELEVSHAFLAEGLPTRAPLPEDAEDKHAGWIEPGFDDSAWWPIAVPASWNTQFPDLWSYEGQGWYRRQVEIPAAWRGKRVAFVSDGANYRTVVYINGQKAGVHEGGYTAFEIPIRVHLRYGEPNTIAISVDNESRLDRVPMERHDWWVHGGLYRPVRLEARGVPEISAVLVETDALGAPPSATIRATIEADATTNGKHTLHATLQDAEGAPVAEGSLETELPESGAALNIKLPVNEARLWSPESPYLYTLELRLTNADGEVTDTRSIRTGIRSIHVEGTKLLLNGQPYLIKGLNRYENYADTGMTSTEENLPADLALVKELGANALRCHYPYSRRTYALCDEIGLLAVCEVPLYQWGRPGHSEKNLEAAKAQLTEMIGTLRNHPSVAFWSVSNETRIRPREPGEEHLRLSQMVARGNLELVDLAHALDPTRPVIEPSNRWPDDVVLGETDLSSVNVYLGVPEPNVAGLAALPPQVKERFAALREQHPGKPILVTEFGSWALRGFKTNYFPGETYQAELLRTYWEAFRQEPDFAGGFIWVFADSDVHRKFTTIYEMRCAYGLYDLQRRPKESAATVQSMWKP